MDREIFQERFGLIGESHALRQVIDKIVQVAATDITVLIEGESGVGKDVTARAIHGLSARKHKDLVIVNCGAIPEGIIESELFGHERGSFTGAHESRQGYFEKADGGTIFLDEIADTPKNVQVKLLRILETGEFFRVGSSQLRKCDVRIIAATNKDLWKSVTEGTFREDLYYRLDTVKIRIPSLRERQDDIIPIFRKFVAEYASKYDSVFQGLSDDAKQLLVSYRWPGNIRELRNVAEQLVVLEKSQYVTADKLQKYLKGRQHLGSPDNLPIFLGSGEQTYSQNKDQELIYRALVELRNEMNDLKKMIGSLIYNSFSGLNINRKALPSATNIDYSKEQEEPKSNTSFGVSSYQEADEVPQEHPDKLSSFFEEKEVPSLEETEKFLIQLALRKFNGNRRKVSEALGISERTLYRKLDQYELS